jgi:hypothetical protein
MAVDITMVTLVSRGQIVLSTDYFNLWEPIAEEILDGDDPGLSEAMYDYCHALLICHLYTTGDTSAAMVSERIGDYSYTRSESNMTPYLIEYWRVIGRFGAVIPTVGVTPTDSTMDELKFDPSDIPSYGGVDS